MMMIAELKRHEGFRSKPYHCPTGHLTIGYGLNLDAGITEREATTLLVMRVNDLESELMLYKWFVMLDRPRKDVIVNMAYNIGLAGLLKFKKMIHYIELGCYLMAANEMLDSRWAEQVGTRAKELANIMRGVNA